MNVLASAVVQSVRAASAETGCSVSVTAKIRLGYKNEEFTFHETVPALEEAGIDALTVNGRTGKQMYTGAANLEKIAEIKNFAHIPVVGNGDIRTSEAALNALKLYGVDG